MAGRFSALDHQGSPIELSKEMINLLAEGRGVKEVIKKSVNHTKDRNRLAWTRVKGALWAVND